MIRIVFVGSVTGTERSRYEKGYIAELVYLEVPLQEVQARIVRNTMTAGRHSIESNVFGEHVRGFEVPNDGEVATVLRNAEDVSRWIESKCRLA